MREFLEWGYDSQNITNMIEANNRSSVRYKRTLRDTF